MGVSKLQLAFERHWKDMHRGQRLKRSVWLKRDPKGTWGDPGYLQPITHFDWMYFKAGAEWQAKQVKRS